MQNSTTASPPTAIPPNSGVQNSQSASQNGSTNNGNNNNLLNQNTPPTSQWFLAEGVAGAGDKPEFFKSDKYKSVAEQAKAYTELEKKLGAFAGAPENYEIKLPPEMKEVQFNTDDALYKDFVQFAKDSNMSNDAFNKVLSIYARYEHYLEESQAQEEKKAMAEEIKKLGGNAWFKEASELKEWANNRLPPELKEIFLDFGTSADAIKLLKYFKSQMAFPQVPHTNGNTTSLPSGVELRARMADKRYQTDEGYRKEVDALYKQVYR
jgi:hypothetical protein